MSLQKTFTTLISLSTKPVLAVAAAEDENILVAIDYLVRQNMVDAILIGNKTIIERIIRQHSMQLTCEIIHTSSKHESVEIAIETIRNNKATMLVKGKVETATLLKAVLHKEKGLRKDDLLSHVSVAQLEDRLLVFADGAMNIRPTIKQKHTIIEQCLQVATHCQFPYLHVGIICAIEKINPKMICTEDASVLKQMTYQFSHAIVDGPFALDNALSLKAAQAKQVQSPIAGDCNVLLMPEIESGNIFYKSLAFIAKIDVAGIIMGAQVPIVVTSRADSYNNKVNAILLACVIASSKA